MTTLVYDFDHKRPACAIIQAACGCNTNSKAFQYFDSEDWLISPTPGMRKIEGTDSQWQKAAEITRANRKKRKS